MIGEYYLLYRNSADTDGNKKRFCGMYQSVKLRLLIPLLAIFFVSNPVSGYEKKIKNPAFNKPIHTVQIPEKYPVPQTRKLRFSEGTLIADLFAQRFAQGHAVYGELFMSPEAGKKDFSVTRVVFNTMRVKTVKRPWGYRFLIGVNPNLGPGKRPLIVYYSVNSRNMRSVFFVPIEDTKYPYYRHPIDLGKYSNVEYHEKPEILRFIQRCTEKKKKAFARVSPDYLGDSFAHPRGMHYITSPFWAVRTYLQYKIRGGRRVYLKNKVRPHRGLDLRGEQGTPVYAIADGEVVLAEKMFYEGNFLLIDHGNRIFSYYMHLDGFDVKPGVRVRAGQQVARVGSSGLSTAAHLHVSFVIQGNQVNPLSVLPLPIRK